MIRNHIPRNIEELAHWYMRYVSPLALVAGVVADNLVLLRRVDLWTSNILLFSYLLLAAACIVLINLVGLGRLRHPFFTKTFPLVPVVAQFAFGGLFSAYFSLYSRSAAYPLGWIFVLVVAALLIGNERFVRLYERFSFQIAMYFTVLFSFLIFFLPVILGRIGPIVFLASGITALAAMGVFIGVLVRIFPERRGERANLVRSIAGIFIGFNVLYFTNAIPPLPLALKEGGVYHRVVRVEDGYELTYEPIPWHESFLRYNTVFHRVAGEPVYVWSAIFAPTGLTTTIFHEWQRYDEDTHTWVTMQRVQYPLQGGRDGGYRGYSLRENVEAGTWRVNVRTADGQLIGRIAFVVIDVLVPVPTRQEVH